jgi:hypothetical protein
MSIWKLQLAVHGSKYSFLLAIIVVILFPNLFSISAHLIRQFMAGCILMYVIVEYVFYDKPKFLLFVIAALLHKSAVFLGLIYLPVFKIEISIKGIILTSITFVFIAYILYYNAVILNSLFSDIQFVSSGFRSLSLLNRRIWTTDELGIMPFLLFSFTLFVFYRIASSKLIPIQQIFYVNIILLFFIIVNYANTEIALRFSMYAFFFAPMAFYFFLLNITSRSREIVSVVVTIFFVIWFVYKIEYGRWIYQNTSELFSILWFANFLN